MAIYWIYFSTENVEILERFFLWSILGGRLYFFITCGMWGPLFLMGGFHFDDHKHHFMIKVMFEVVIKYVSFYPLLQALVHM